MKNYMNHVCAFLLCTFALTAGIQAQTTLEPGDVALLRILAEDPTGSGNTEEIDFVFLIDVEAGTSIRFADGGWNGTELRATETGEIEYTVPTGGHTAGTVITLSYEQNDCTINSPASDATAITSCISLSTSGDQILMYTGTFASPSFVFIGMTNSTQFQGPGSNDPNQSDLPDVLVEGLTGVAAGASSGAESEFDNIYYSGSLTSATKNEWLERIGNASNWTGDNTAANVSVSYGSSISVNDATVSENVSLASDRWHMVANPFRNVNVATYLSDGWTQGFTGSDEASFGQSNVYTFTESSNGGEYTQFTGENLSYGQGFIYYYYLDADNNNGTADDNDFALNTTSETFAPHGTIALAHTDNDASNSVNGDEGWHLLGNPFEADLSVDAVLTALQTVDGSANANVYVWDPTAGAWDIKASGGSEIVSAGQAFFVRLGTDGASGDFEFNYATMNTTGGTFLKQALRTSLNATIEVSMDGLLATHALQFADDAQIGLDPKDAYYMTPLTAMYLSIFSSVDEADVVINYLPTSLSEEVRIPVNIESTETGTATLSWGEINIPEGLSIRLVDTATENQYDLSTPDSFNVEITGIAQGKTISEQLNSGSIRAKTNDNARFALVITSSQAVNNETEPTTPEAFVLDQNYPNPFNPTTNIRYTVPNSGLVNVSIYNVMGQKVATLVNTTQSAGTYTATWNAANNASGIYYYRLESAGQSITRQMTLIK
ncbi:MAG: T9SS type A sorting domain-containing protein [Bacteroidota bacterium]